MFLGRVVKPARTIVHPASLWWWMTRNPLTRLGQWLHKRATDEQIETINAEPEWLPEDRDVVDMYLAEKKTRHSCGHFPWQSEDLDGLELGYQVCPICAEQTPYEEKIREQNRARSEDQYGLTFGWFTPREESDGD